MTGTKIDTGGAPVRGWSLNGVETVIASPRLQDEQRRNKFNARFREVVEQQKNVTVRVSTEDGTVIYDAGERT